MGSRRHRYEERLSIEVVGKTLEGKSVIGGCFKLFNEKQAIKPARILFVLDKSGSMSDIRSDTIGGYNTYVTDQQKLKAKTIFTLAQFNERYNLTYDGVDIKNVVPLNEVSYFPGGGTALNDAIGKTVTMARSQQRPKDELTILVILTDGQENSSKEYSKSAVQALLKAVQDELGWEVLFLGANIDAQREGGSLGVMRSSTMTFDANAKGINDAYTTASMKSMSTRGFVDDKLRAYVDSNGILNTQALYGAVKSGEVKKET